MTVLTMSAAEITRFDTLMRLDRSLLVRVSQNVTMHGFALNANPDLGWASVIVPCGIADAGVSSLSIEAGREITVADVLPYTEKHLAEVLTLS